MLRRVVVVALCLVTALGAYMAWDFIKLGRKPPAMTASEQRASLIRVDKQARRMTLLRAGEPIKSYQIALGGNPVGPKQREGDSRTPEGRYFIDAAVFIWRCTSPIPARKTRHGRRAMVCRRAATS